MRVAKKTFWFLVMFVQMYWMDWAFGWLCAYSASQLVRHQVPQGRLLMGLGVYCFIVLFQLGMIKAFVGATRAGATHGKPAGSPVQKLAFAMSDNIMAPVRGVENLRAKWLRRDDTQPIRWRWTAVGGFVAGGFLLMTHRYMNGRAFNQTFRWHSRVSVGVFAARFALTYMLLSAAVWR